MMMSGCKIADELHLPLGETASDRNDGRAQSLAAVMGAKPTGEQAVAVSDVNLVGGAAAGGADRARHQQRPGVDVAFGIADDGRLAGGAARSVDAHDVGHRHREHAERIILPEILLGGERKFGEIGKLFQVGGMHACRVEFLLVVRDALVSLMQCRLETIELQRNERILAGLFDRLKLVERAHLCHSALMPRFQNDRRPAWPVPPSVLPPAPQAFDTRPARFPGRLS